MHLRVALRAGNATLIVLPLLEIVNQIASNSLLSELPATSLIPASLHDNRNKFRYRRPGCRLLTVVGSGAVVHKPHGISSKSRREFRVCRGGERQEEETFGMRGGGGGREGRREGGGVGVDSKAAWHVAGSFAE